MFCKDASNDECERKYRIIILKINGIVWYIRICKHYLQNYNV